MTWMYRLQQRLAITRHESIAILALSGILLLGLAVKHVRTPEAPPDPAAYAKVDARFEARTAALPGANRPAASSASISSDSSGAEAEAHVRINLNTASSSTLQQLPGIGPALSSRILDHRSAHGAFVQVDDITRVRGIGPKTLARLKPMLYVDTIPSRSVAQR